MVTRLVGDIIGGRRWPVDRGRRRNERQRRVHPPWLLVLGACRGGGRRSRIMRWRWCDVVRRWTSRLDRRCRRRCRPWTWTGLARGPRRQHQLDLGSSGRCGRRGRHRRGRHRSSLGLGRSGSSHWHGIVVVLSHHINERRFLSVVFLHFHLLLLLRGYVQRRIISVGLTVARRRRRLIHGRGNVHGPSQLGHGLFAIVAHEILLVPVVGGPLLGGGGGDG